jgi:hypothetical protein
MPSEPYDPVRSRSSGENRRLPREFGQVGCRAQNSTLEKTVSMIEAPRKTTNIW